MTAELSGRELDCAVAEAIYGKRPPIWPRFSTEGLPMALETMLAWLQSRSTSLEWRWDSDLGWHVERYDLDCTCKLSDRADGTTLPETLARLVVAVAAKEPRA